LIFSDWEKGKEIAKQLFPLEIFEQILPFYDEFRQLVMSDNQIRDYMDMIAINK